MYQRHDKQYDSKTSISPERVFRQELVTWAETDNGFVRTILTRYFGQDGQRDVYEAEPTVLQRCKGGEAYQATTPCTAVQVALVRHGQS